MISSTTYPTVRIETIKVLDRNSTILGLAPRLSTIHTVLVDLQGSINYWLWDTGVRICWDSTDPMAI